MPPANCPCLRISLVSAWPCLKITCRQTPRLKLSLPQESDRKDLTAKRLAHPSASRGRWAMSRMDDMVSPRFQKQPNGPTDPAWQKTALLAKFGIAFRRGGTPCPEKAVIFILVDSRQIRSPMPPRGHFARLRHCFVSHAIRHVARGRTLSCEHQFGGWESVPPLQSLKPAPEGRGLEPHRRISVVLDTPHDQSAHFAANRMSEEESAQRILLWTWRLQSRSDIDRD